MDIYNIITVLPESVKLDIIDFTDVKLKSGDIAVRITLDRLLTTEEKQFLKLKREIIGVDCVAVYRYAPEIARSYFYLVKE